MELELTDLRIGNELEYGDHTTKLDVNMIRDWSLYRKQLKPIMITEDWSDRLPYDDKHGVTLAYCDNVMVFHYKGVCVGVRKYLHDIQNLYYAITKHELVCLQ